MLQEQGNIENVNRLSPSSYDEGHKGRTFINALHIDEE
jgi:hypothetical protein